MASTCLSPDLADLLSRAALKRSPLQRKAFRYWLQRKPEARAAAPPLGGSSVADAPLWQITELQIHTSHIRAST